MRYTKGRLKFACCLMGCYALLANVCSLVLSCLRLATIYIHSSLLAPGADVAAYMLMITYIILISLTIALIYANVKDEPSLFFPWVFGVMFATVLELFCVVYSNLVVFTIYQLVDGLAKIEIGWFITKFCSNIICLFVVVFRWHQIRTHIWDDDREVML